MNLECGVAQICMYMRNARHPRGDTPIFIAYRSLSPGLDNSTTKTRHSLDTHLDTTLDTSTHILAAPCGVVVELSSSTASTASTVARQWLDSGSTVQNNSTITFAQHDEAPQPVLAACARGPEPSVLLNLLCKLPYSSFSIASVVLGA